MAMKSTGQKPQEEPRKRPDRLKCLLREHVTQSWAGENILGKKDRLTYFSEAHLRYTETNQVCRQ